MKRFLARTIGVEDLSEKIDRVLTEARDRSEGKIEVVRDRVDQLEKHILDLLVEVSALRMDLAREFEALDKPAQGRAEAK